MKKYAYLAKLEELLQELPPQERDDALNYYEEYFDAAGRENEEATAAELGDPAEVAREILAGTGQADAAPVSFRPAPDDKPAPAAGTAEQPPAEPPVPDAEPPKSSIPEIRPVYLILPLLVVIAVVFYMIWPRTLETASRTDAASSEAEFAASEPIPNTADTTEGTQASAFGAALDKDAADANTYEAYLYAENGKCPKSISIDVKNADVVIEPAEGDTFFAVLRSADSESYQQAMTYSDGLYSLTGGTESDASASVTLYLPQSGDPLDTLDRVEILTTKGSVEVYGELNAEQIVIHAGAELSTEAVTATELELRSTWGNVTAGMLDAADIRLRAASGSVTAGLKEYREAYYIQAQSDGDKVLLDGQDYGSSVTAGTEDFIPLNAQAAVPCSLNFGAN